MASLLTWAIGAILGYVTFVAHWRLYRSPIGHFPGPKIAALTYLYEFYYDVWKPGLFLWEIERLHKIYGPVIRINPKELHFDDTGFYHTIYAGSTQRRDVHDFSRRGLDASLSLGGTVLHDTHRRRREALNPFFARKNITATEPLIRSKIDHLCDRLSKCRDPVTLNDAFLALTVDIIGQFAFGEDYGYLDRPDFGGEWRRNLMSMMQKSKLLAHCIWLVELMKLLPEWLVQRCGPPAVADLLAYQKHIRSQIIDIVTAPQSTSDHSHPTVFHELRDSPTLPPEEKTIDRLQQEGQVLVAAGSETTAKTLSIIFYHLLADPTNLSRLKEELSSTPAEHSWEQLEQLPWLSSVVSEGLRLNFGIVGRTQRVSPDADLPYREWSIPAGTPMSMMSYFAHTNADLFPDPWKFVPQRWIGVDAQRKRKFLVSFGKGSRTCIAIHLATAELCLTISALLRRFDFELYKTDIRDVQLEHDFVVLQPKLGSKGVRVIVQGRKGMV